MASTITTTVANHIAYPYSFPIPNALAPPFLNPTPYAAPHYPHIIHYYQPCHLYHGVISLIIIMVIRQCTSLSPHLLLLLLRQVLIVCKSFSLGNISMWGSYKTRNGMEWNQSGRALILKLAKIQFFVLSFLSVWLFYYCFTVNNATMQYTRNILFNAHCHVVDLIHTVGVNYCWRV